MIQWGWEVQNTDFGVIASIFNFGKCRQFIVFFACRLLCIYAAIPMRLNFRAGGTQGSVTPHFLDSKYSSCSY